MSSFWFRRSFFVSSEAHSAEGRPNNCRIGPQRWVHDRTKLRPQSFIVAHLAFFCALSTSSAASRASSWFCAR